MPAEERTLSEEAVLPCNCLLAFGLPTTEKDFEAAIYDPHRDYAKQYFGGWKQYNRNFVHHVIDFTQRYSELGVRVVTGLRLSGFAELFSEAAVVTIFTHWSSRGIELCDGMQALHQVVHSVPPGFSGVFDLCVCHPDELVRLLLRDRPRCSVRYLSNEAKPLFWLNFYSAVYQVAALGGRSYSEVLDEVTRELRRQTKRNKTKKTR